MKALNLLCAGIAALLMVPGGASAAAVTCGQAPGLRVTMVDPGLVGGVCVTGLVNFNPAEAETAVATATGLTATHLDKDEAGDSSLGAQNAWLTGYTNTTSGNWTVSDDAWAVYQRLFLGFHFGNAGGGDASNPDWFIVEIARSDNAGTWELGGAGARLNGLSHIDLIGAGSCAANPKACDGGGGGGGNLPEPGSIALVGLALAGAGLALRRRKG